MSGMGVSPEMRGGKCCKNTTSVRAAIWDQHNGLPTLWPEAMSGIWEPSPLVLFQCLGVMDKHFQRQTLYKPVLAPGVC